MKLIFPIMLATSLTACQINYTGDAALETPTAAPEIPVMTTPGVGMTYFNIVDEQRFDAYGTAENEFRDIMVKIWYPADIKAEEQPVHMWYHSDEQRLPLPDYDSPNAPAYVQDLLNTPSKSHLNAQPQSGQFPVVFFSHGYWSNMEQNQYLMEHLVEQGYILVSVAHNYHTNLMTQADGSINVFDWNLRFSDFDLAAEADVNADELNNEINALIDVDLNEAQKERVYQLIDWAEGDKDIINNWVLDTHKVYEVLEQLNQNNHSQVISRNEDMPSFTNNFDFNNIAMVGGSFGGLNALDFCNQLDACKGAVNFDSQHYNLERNGNYHKPYMMQLSDKGIYPMIKLIMEQQSAPVYVVEVLGAEHGNFSDSSLHQISPDLGSIEGQRMIDLMNLSVSAFLENVFDKTISDQELVDLLTQQPEFIVTLDAE